MTTPASPKDIARTEGDKSRADQKTDQPIGEESLSLVAERLAKRASEIEAHVKKYPEYHSESQQHAADLRAILERLALPSGGGGGSARVSQSADAATTGSGGGSDSGTTRARPLETAWNFPGHPGGHCADRSSEQADAPSYRQGWIDAVAALQAAISGAPPQTTETGQ